MVELQPENIWSSPYELTRMPGSVDFVQSQTVYTHNFCDNINTHKM